MRQLANWLEKGTFLLLKNKEAGYGYAKGYTWYISIRLDSLAPESFGKLVESLNLKSKVRLTTKNRYLLELTRADMRKWLPETKALCSPITQQMIRVMLQALRMLEAIRKVPIRFRRVNKTTEKNLELLARKLSKLKQERKMGRKR